MSNPGRVVSYDNLSRYIWKDDYLGTVESIRVYIQRIRNKLKRKGLNKEFIKTKPGIGYMIDR